MPNSHALLAERFKTSLFVCRVGIHADAGLYS
jgi:hypothetical protein